MRLMASAFPNVVDREDVVIHDPLNKVEETPADEHPADKDTSAARPAPIGSAAPEDVDPYRDCDPGSGVKEAVPEGVRL